MTTIVPTVRVVTQLGCEELGEQPAIKFRFSRGQLTAIINCPVSSQDTDEVRRNKIDLCVSHFKAELERCSQNSGA